MKGRILLVLYLLHHASAWHLTASQHAAEENGVPSASLLARGLLQNGSNTPSVPAPPPPAIRINASSNSTKTTKSGKGFSALIATTIAASTGAIGVVSGVAGVAAANVGAGTVVQAAGALNMQATSAAVVQMIQHIQVFASMDAPVQQLTSNSTYRLSMTKNITDALSWITFSTRGSRCRTGLPGQPAPMQHEKSRCLWRSGKNHVIIVAIVLGVTVAIHALFVLLWHFTIGLMKPMPVILVPPNIELMLGGIFVLPLAAAVTQLIAADTARSIALAAAVIAFLGAYFLFLIYVLMGIVAHKKRYGLVYKRSVSTHGHNTNSNTGLGSGPGSSSGSGKGLQRATSGRKQMCMNINWPQWHGEWQVDGVPEDQRVTYRKQYIRTSRWYGFLARINQKPSSGESAKVVSVEIEDRLGALHDPYRGDNILAYNWELVKLGYLVAQGCLLAATEASLTVGAMSWSLLWLQVTYTVLMTVIRPYRNQWLGFLDIAANWVRVGTFIAFIQLANYSANLQRNLLSRLELASTALVLLSAWVRILAMFIKVEGIYFAIKKPRFLSWAHNSIKQQLPFTAQHIDRVEAVAHEVERVRSGRLPDTNPEAHLLKPPLSAPATQHTQQQHKPAGRASDPITQLPPDPITAELLRKPATAQGPAKTQTHQATAHGHHATATAQPQPSGAKVSAGGISPAQVKLQMQPGEEQPAQTQPSGARPSRASGQPQQGTQQAQQLQQKLPAQQAGKQATQQTPQQAGKQASQPTGRQAAQQAGMESATAMQLPEISHLQPVELREEEEQVEQGRQAVALSAGEDTSRRPAQKMRPVLDRPPSPPAKLGELWSAGIGQQQGGVSGNNAGAPGQTSTPAGQRLSSDDQIATASDQLSATAGQTLTPAQQGSVGGQEMLGHTGQVAPATGQTSGMPGQTSGVAGQMPGTLGAGSRQASLRSGVADAYHSVDSEFDQVGRHLADDSGWEGTAAGHGPHPGRATPAPEDKVLDVILRDMLMDIMSSRPATAESMGPISGMLETSMDDVEEALQVLFQEMQESRGNEDTEPVDMEQLRLRLHLLHQDIMSSFQDPASPGSSRLTTASSYSTDRATAISALRRAYSVRHPARPAPATMRFSQSMPAAVGGLVLPETAMAGTAVAEDLGVRPGGPTSVPHVFGRSHTDVVSRAPGNAPAYRYSQSLPTGTAAGLAAAAVAGADAQEASWLGVCGTGLQDSGMDAGDSGMDAGDSSATATTWSSHAPAELRRVHTTTPARSAQVDAVTGIQYSRTMPAAVTAAATDLLTGESFGDDNTSSDMQIPDPSQPF